MNQNEMYQVKFKNCNGIAVQEFVKYPWQAHKRAKELQDAEIWYKNHCVKAYKSESIYPEKWEIKTGGN
jgi:hypothetical protein